MQSMSFDKFKRRFESDALKLKKVGPNPTNQKAVQARKLLAKALSEKRTVVEREKIVRAACKLAGISDSLISGSFAASFSKSGNGHETIIWTLYFYFHWHQLHTDFIVKADKILLGAPFEKAAKRPVRVKAEINPSKTRSAWAVKDETLAVFFEPVMPKQGVDQLIEITHEVVNESLESNPIDYKTSIVERAQTEGLIDSGLETQWLTAGLSAGLRPDVNRGFSGEGSEAFEQLYREKWRFLSSSPTDDEKSWIEKIAANSEDREFLDRELESTTVQTPEGAKRIKLLECLIATQDGLPLINHSESVIGHLIQMSEMNLSQSTKNFLDYSLARNAAVTGQSELAIQNYYRLKDKKFLAERAIDIRYNMINASYALRMNKHYGSEAVSTEIRLSADRSEETQRQLNSEKLDGFDANKEITKFCSDFSIDPETVTTSSIQDYVKRFNGPNGAKIIYFFHLEKILRTKPSERLLIRERYEDIVRMLKLLSDTARAGDTSVNFTTDAWYPLVFLHSIAGNLGDYDLMKTIENTIDGFEGWKHASNLRESVQKERDQGSFLMLLHEFNRGMGVASKGVTVNIRSEVEKFKSQFKTLRFMPALFQTVTHGLREIGDEYDPLWDVSALSRRGVSHWNYMDRWR
ncbi:hypothetical protein R2A130_0291 [Ahrensia sp. R2A130]|nr:hypothetical protein R2A130_0291 [Ahrensia sp. R2A130]